MYKKRMNHKEVKKLVLKVVADCRGLAADHIRNWQPVNETWQTIEGAVYLCLSDDTQVAVERGSLEQQIHIAISEAQHRSEQERINYKITEFYIEPGITGTHGNRPEFIRLQQNISLKQHSFVIFKEISRLVRDLEMARSFREEYKERVSNMKNEERELCSRRKQLKLLQKQITEVQVPQNGKLEQIKAALGYIRKKYFAALKSIYKQLFEKVVVRPLETAKVQLEFIFKDLSTVADNFAVANCTVTCGMGTSEQDTELLFNQKLSMRSGIYNTSPRIPESLIKQKYLEDRLSIREIAREFSCSKSHVRNQLLKYSIPLREPFKLHKDNSRVYGKRKVGSRVVNYKGEIRTITAIKKMYGEGVSTRAIAIFPPCIWITKNACYQAHKSDK